MSSKGKNLIFTELSAPLIESGQAEESTMMGCICLRYKGEFFASEGFNDKDIIIKVPALRVTELVESGKAEPFIPNGKVFKEWAIIPHPSIKTASGYAQEALNFAKTNITKKTK